MNKEFIREVREDETEEKPNVLGVALVTSGIFIVLGGLLWLAYGAGI